VRNIYREQRIDELLNGKVGSIRVEDLKAIMRDHYEGRTNTAVPPYYNVDAVHGSPHVGAKFRNICVTSTESSVVHHLRNYLPDPIGGLMWATLGCSCTSIYLPYYVGTQSVPTPFMTGLEGSTNYDPASAWWTYERLQHTIDNNYPAAKPHVRQVLDNFEKGAENDSKDVEQKALKAYNAGKTDKALSILTDFTTKKLNDGYDLLNGMTTYAYGKTLGLYPAIPGLT
jgi:dipeptidase